MDQAYWDSVADRFDAEVLKILDRDLNGTLSRSLSEIASASKSVADFGCGNGSLTPLIASLFGSVHAIDFSERLLQAAKERNGEFDNVRFERADLSRPFDIHRKVDALICINVLISPDEATRNQILENAVASLRRRGHLVVVVPAYESLLHSYRTIVESNVVLGMKREAAVREVQAVYEEEVDSPVEGIVTLGAEPTKLHTREEIIGAMEDQGLTGVQTRRIEFAWEEMIDDAPDGLASPYPWDWLVIAKKP